MYGLQLCKCGGTVYNDDTGLCDHCTHEQLRAEAEAEIVRLSAALDHAEAHIGELEYLVNLARVRALDALAAEFGHRGRFRIVTAAQMLPGDRLLRPVQAIIGTAAAAGDAVVLTLKGGRTERLEATRPVAVWIPDKPYAPCRHCEQSLFTGCSLECPVDAFGREALARTAAASRASGKPAGHEPTATIGAWTAGARPTGGIACHRIQVRLRPADCEQGEEVAALLGRVGTALATLPEPVGTAPFTLADAPDDLDHDTADLACAAAILAAHGRAAPERLEHALLWARIDADGTLRSPGGAIDPLAVQAAEQGLTHLVTAAEPPSTMADDGATAVRLDTLTDFAAWLAGHQRLDPPASDAAATTPGCDEDGCEADAAFEIFDLTGAGAAFDTTHPTGTPERYCRDHYSPLSAWPPLHFARVIEHHDPPQLRRGHDPAPAAEQ